MVNNLFGLVWIWSENTSSKQLPFPTSTLLACWKLRMPGACLCERIYSPATGEDEYTLSLTNVCLLIVIWEWGKVPSFCFAINAQRIDDNTIVLTIRYVCAMYAWLCAYTSTQLNKWGVLRKLRGEIHSLRSYFNQKKPNENKTIGRCDVRNKKKI